MAEHVFKINRMVLEIVLGFPIIFDRRKKILILQTLIIFKLNSQIHEYLPSLNL